MKVPVFLTVPPDHGLLETMRSGQTTIRSRARQRLGKFVKDLDFPDLTLDSARTTLGNVAHAIRGIVEVDNIDDVPESIDGHLVLADPRVDTYATCFNDGPIGTAAEVAAKLNVTELHSNGLNGEDVAIAIVDTGINLDFLEAKLGFRPRLDAAYSWRPPGVNVDPGAFPVGHGTMSAYAALIAAPKATLIDVPAFVGTPAGGSPMGRRLSLAFQGISQLSSYWSIAFTASGQPKYKALVINNSWGMYHPSWDFPPGHRGRYSDNPLHVFTRAIAAMSSVDEVDVVFAAGNCGAECPDQKCQNVTSHTITGANACAEVLTIAACNVLDQRVGYSSQGPAIAGMRHDKPDLAAYAHFSGSQALGAGQPDKGTSTASPIVAGCIAALRTQFAPDAVPPATLNDLLRRTARRPQDANWNEDVGYGIVNPVAVAAALTTS